MLKPFVCLAALALASAASANAPAAATGRQFIFASAAPHPPAPQAVPRRGPMPDVPGLETAMVETLEDALAASEEPHMSEEPGMSEEPDMSEEPMMSAEPEMEDGEYEFAYNIGGNATDNGKYQADPVEYLFGDGETGTFAVSDAAVGGAEPDNHDAYMSHRYGVDGATWGYSLPVQVPGMYNCTLHYAETHSDFFTDEPNRTFSVTVQGDASEVLHEIVDLDVMVELGGAEFTALTRTFELIAIQETLTILQTPSVGDAFLSAVSCAWAKPLQ